MLNETVRGFVDQRQDRITLRNYSGGHMMYLHEPSLKSFSADIRAFIRGE